MEECALAKVTGNVLSKPYIYTYITYLGIRCIHAAVLMHCVSGILCERGERKRGAKKLLEFWFFLVGNKRFFVCPEGQFRPDDTVHFEGGM